MRSGYIGAQVGRIKRFLTLSIERQPGANLALVVTGLSSRAVH
jgi:hypothetical protein